MKRTAAVIVAVTLLFAMTACNLRRHKPQPTGNTYNVQERPTRG